MHVHETLTLHLSSSPILLLSYHDCVCVCVSMYMKLWHSLNSPSLHVRVYMDMFVCMYVQMDFSLDVLRTVNAD
jgi:hypothetical protein